MDENNVYLPFNKFILRTPLFPLGFVKNLTSGPDLDEHQLKSLFSDPVLKETIFIASPHLYYEMEKWLDGNSNSEQSKKEQKKAERLKESLLRYLFRMSTRCTPFGLFAGFSAGNFADKTEIKPESKENNRCHTRLDMNYLCALALDLSKNKAIKDNLKFYPNSSIYTIGNQIRYVEYKYMNSHRVHQIVAVDNSEYINTVLQKAENGEKIMNLAKVLVDDEITLKEATGFIHEMIDEQLLVSELEPPVTGDDFLIQMIKILQEISDNNEVADIVKKLIDVNERLTLLKRIPIGKEITAYTSITDRLKSFSTKYDIKFLFQTDMVKQNRVCNLKKSVAIDLQKVIEVLNRLNPYKYEDNLSQFKKAFRERYEEEEVPLVQALDTETGIGYIQNVSSDINPLVDDLALPFTENGLTDIKWSRVFSFLHKKYREYLIEKKRTIELSDKDINQFPVNYDDLPQTIAAMVQVFQSDGNAKHEIYIKSLGGSSAANLIGRFCYADEDAYHFTKSIIQKDETNKGDVIYAEIVHLPESRTGNILYRPVLREYEILYLAKSSVPENNQIKVDDLMVSVRGNMIYLRSKKFNKIIIPRLTTAHNYSYNALPVYRFLCDMQTQNLRAGFGFNWGHVLEAEPFLPRVTYNNIILSRARWLIQKSDITDVIKENDSSKRYDLFMIFKNSFGIYDEVLLADSDNELYLNLKNKTSVDVLINQIKNRSSFVLKEFLFNNNNLIVKGNEGGFTNEFIIAFYKNHLKKE